MGFGWILCDNKATNSRSYKSAYPPREVGVLAIREALSWLKDQNMEKVQVESDTLLIIQSLELIDDESFFDLILHNKDLLSQFIDINIFSVK